MALGFHAAVGIGIDIAQIHGHAFAVGVVNHKGRRRAAVAGLAGFELGRCPIVKADGAPLDGGLHHGGADAARNQIIQRRLGVATAFLGDVFDFGELTRFTLLGNRRGQAEPTPEQARGAHKVFGRFGIKHQIDGCAAAAGGVVFPALAVLALFVQA